jgi:hypothetical protein
VLCKEPALSLHTRHVKAQSLAVDFLHAVYLIVPVLLCCCCCCCCCCSGASCGVRGAVAGQHRGVQPAVQESGKQATSAPAILFLGWRNSHRLATPDSVPQVGQATTPLPASLVCFQFQGCASLTGWPHTTHSSHPKAVQQAVQQAVQLPAGLSGSSQASALHTLLLEAWR